MDREANEQIGALRAKIENWQRQPYETATGQVLNAMLELLEIISGDARREAKASAEPTSDRTLEIAIATTIARELGIPIERAAKATHDELGEAARKVILAVRTHDAPSQTPSQHSDKE